MKTSLETKQEIESIGLNLAKLQCSSETSTGALMITCDIPQAIGSKRCTGYFSGEYNDLSEAYWQCSSNNKVSFFGFT